LKFSKAPRKMGLDIYPILQKKGGPYA